jgi:hypothetical protein
MAADRAAYEDARRVDESPWDGAGVHPGRVVATLNRVLSPDTIVTTDAGNFGGWAARGLVLRRPGTFLGTTAGAMGFAIPAAIAASLAGPGRPVVALVGDGGAGMTIAELETAIREGVHPVVLVFDNERYGTIHDHQVRRGLAPVATDLGPVDWVRVAEGFGALGVRIDRDEELEPALRAGLSADVPTVLHLVLDRRWASVDRFGDVEPVPHPGLEPDPAAVAEAEIEPAAVPEPEVEHDPEPRRAAEPVGDAEAQDEPLPKAGPEPQAEPVGDAEAQDEPLPGAGPEPQAEPGPARESEPDAEPEAVPAANPGAPATP